MDNKKINKLFEKISMGDEEAFTTFYNSTYKGVFSFIYSYVKDWHVTEDLLQETYIKVKLNIDKYKKNSNAISWILQIAKNLSLDYLRKDKSNIELNESISGYSTDVNLSLDLHDALNKYLEEDERQIVILHVIFGYKHREIAKFIGIPHGTVLWKYNKAIKILKDKLEGGKL